MFRYTSIVTTEQFIQQQVQLSEQIINEQKQQPKLVKRKVGRPLHQIQADEILIDNNNDSFNITDNAVKSMKRAHYVNWFQSEFIHEILDAYRINKSGYLAVKYLNKRFPQLATESAPKFALLRDSTIDGWFDDSRK